MPKSSPIQTDFSGGEFGALVEGRTDVERYKTGLEICSNYIPTLEGPLDRRPGTKRVTSVKDPSKPPIFIPFKISNSEQYVLEVGERYIRFFTDQGQVVTSGSSYVVKGEAYLARPEKGSNRVTGPFFATRSTQTDKAYEHSGISTFSSLVSGSIVELPTFYDYNMIQNLGVAQKGNTLWLMHSSIPTFTLQRFTPQDWDLKLFRPKDGPYLPFKSSRTTGDVLNAKLMINTPIDDPTLEQNSVGLIAHSTCVISNVINDGTGRAQVFVRSTHNYLTGDDVFINGVSGVTSVNNSPAGLVTDVINPANSSRWKIEVVNASSFILLNSVFGGLYTGSGRVTPAVFFPEDTGRTIGFYIGGRRYTGVITTGTNIFDVNYAGGNQGAPVPIIAGVSLDADSKLYGSVIQNTTIIDVWQMGAYSRVNGWPSAGAFHQDRLVLTGTPGRPSEFASSNTGDYQAFNVNAASSLAVLETNSLQYNLTTSSTDGIEWVESGVKGLYFASNDTEYLVSPSREGEALTPTNVSNDIIGYYGSSSVPPIRQGDAIIYVQNSKQKVREIRFFENVQSHKSTNISQISDHIPRPGIVGLANQKEVYPIIWGYRTDGVLVSMSYSREETQAVAGWARHQLGGKSDSSGTEPQVKAIAVIRDSTGNYDQLWMAVQRFINGTSDVVVEYMTQPYRHKDPTQKQRDAYHLDCGATYDSSLVIASITTGSALVGVTNHGFARNDLVLIDDVIGLNSSLVNVNGVAVGSNLVNGKVFVVGSTTANGFFLQDFNSSIILTNTYSPYVSGGKVRKLVSSVGGLTWLKNEEVDVLADGGIHGKVIVNSAGVIALNNPAAVVQVGYAYKSRGKTLVRDEGSATGSAIGMNSKAYQLAFRLRNVGDFSYGGLDFDNLHQANFGAGDYQQADAAVPLFTGLYRDGIEQNYSLETQIYFEQSSPLPGLVQSITYMMEEHDL